MGELAELPNMLGLNNCCNGVAPGPKLLDFNLLQELTLRKILLAGGCKPLPRIDMEDFFKKSATDKLKAHARVEVNGLRRRLMSKVAGYRPHDHASPRRHIHRLMASEAA